MHEAKLPNERRIKAWWESPWLLLSAVLLCGLPLLWPHTPPLNDYPGHIGRYSIQLRLVHSPILQQWYRLDWDLIPNLGIDLIMEALRPFTGASASNDRLELSAKLVAIFIALAQGAGFLAVSRQAHGRIPPTAYFALAVIFTYPFNWGFANFSLSVGLSFILFSLWGSMENRGLIRLRSIIFIPLSIMLWVCHIYGWAILSVLAFSNTVTRRIGGGNRVKWFLGCAARGAPLLSPLVLKLLWPSKVGVEPTTEWFDFGQKIRWVFYLFRDSNMAWDLLALAVCIGLIVGAVVSRRFRIHPGLALAFLIFSTLYWIMPTVILGSDYADMRLLPAIFATGILMIGPMTRGSAKAATIVAAAGLAFFVARTGVTTLNFLRYDREYKREFAALDHVPIGARMITIFNQTCRTGGWMRTDWRLARMDHLGGIALTRRQAYAPDQWTMIGGQPLRLSHPPEGLAGHEALPPLRTTDEPCSIPREPSLAYDLARLPKHAFDYLWVIDQGSPADMPGWKLVWRNARSGLYRATAPTGKPISG